MERWDEKEYKNISKDREYFCGIKNKYNKYLEDSSNDSLKACLTILDYPPDYLDNVVQTHIYDTRKIIGLNSIIPTKKSEKELYSKPHILRFQYMNDNNNFYAIRIKDKIHCPKNGIISSKIYEKNIIVLEEFEFNPQEISTKIQKKVESVNILNSIKLLEPFEKTTKW